MDTFLFFALSKGYLTLFCGKLSIDMYQTPGTIITQALFDSVSPEDIDTNSEVSLCKC